MEYSYLKNNVLVSIKELSKRLIERDQLIRLTTLSILSKSHMFLIGERGVAKSLTIRLFSNLIKDIKYWELLIGSDTESKQLFGEKQVAENGTIYYNAQNTILDSHIVFLDEMFKAKNEVLNMTLQIMADRYYTTGDGRMIDVPLISMIGASNEYPTGALIEPFVDRILIWHEVKRIQNPENRKKYFMSLFDKTPIEKPIFTLDDIDIIAKKSRKITIPGKILSDIDSIINKLLVQDVKTSDRKYLSTIEQVMKTSAFLNQRDVLDESDVFLFLFTSWHNDVERRKVHESIFYYYFLNEATFSKKIEKLKKDVETIETKTKGELYDFFNYSVVFSGESAQKEFEWHKRMVLGLIEAYSKIYDDLLEIKQKIEEIFIIEEKVKDNIFLENLKNNSISEKMLTILEHYESNIVSEYNTISSWIENNTRLIDYKQNQALER